MRGPTKHTERLPRREANRRAKEDAVYIHALERLRERHDPSAELGDVVILGVRAASIYGSYKNQCRTSEGQVVSVESDGCAVVRLPYQDPQNYIKVVYDPASKALRTVLPKEPNRNWRVSAT